MSPEEKVGPKTRGITLILVGMIIVLAAFSIVFSGQGMTALNFIAMVFLLVLGIVLAFYGFTVLMNPNLPPSPRPAPFNEVEIVCERCEKVIPPNAIECPHCGQSIEY